MTSVVTSIAANLKSALSGITGMQAVYRVGQEIDISAITTDTGFPVALLKTGPASPLGGEKTGSVGMILRQTEFRIVVLDNGRTAGTADWSAQRAEELEALVMAAVMADRTRGGYARNTVWTHTEPNPTLDGIQIDAMVEMTFDVIHRHKETSVESYQP